MIFPFFVFLFSNCRRALLVTLIALLMNIVSIYYFNVERTNMFYSFIYFCVGGLIYLYRNMIIKLVSNHRILSLFAVIISIILYFTLPRNEYLLVIRIILLCVVLISYSISINSKFLDNKVTKFIGGISFEIYLAHMFVFRVIEKLHLTHIFSNNYLSYLVTCIFVLVGVIIFSKVFQIFWIKIEEKVLKNENIIS